jgi:hypothetical protein
VFEVTATAELHILSHTTLSLVSILWQLQTDLNGAVLCWLSGFHSLCGASCFIEDIDRFLPRVGRAELTETGPLTALCQRLGSYHQQYITLIVLSVLYLFSCIYVIHHSSFS